MDEAVEAGQASFRSPDPASMFRARHQHPGGNDHSGRNRPRCEPFSDGWAPARMGRDVSRPERERRQTEILASAQGAPGSRPSLCNAPGRPREEGQLLRAQFKRLRAKRGPKKAICAVAASMLTAIYHMLRDGTHHQDLGAGSLRPTLERGQSQSTTPSRNWPGSASTPNYSAWRRQPERSLKVPIRKHAQSDQPAASDCANTRPAIKSH